MALEDDETGNAAGWNPPGVPGQITQLYTIQSPVDLETGMSIEATFWNPAEQDAPTTTFHIGGKCFSVDMDTSTDRFIIDCRPEGFSASRPLTEGSTPTYIIAK